MSVKNLEFHGFSMDFPWIFPFFCPSEGPNMAKLSPLPQVDLPALTSFKFGSLSSAGGGQTGVCLMCLFRIEGFNPGSIIQLDQFGSQTDHVAPPLSKPGARYCFDAQVVVTVICLPPASEARNEVRTILNPLNLDKDVETVWKNMS